MRRELIALEKEAKEIKKKIDSINNEIFKIIRERDSLNRKFSDLIKEGKENKEKRDKINEVIKKMKEPKLEKLEEIKTINQKMEELKLDREKILNLLKTKKLSYERDPEALKKKIDEMEWRLQTTVMSISAEKKLLEKIKDMNKQYIDSKKIFEINRELKGLFSKRKELKEKIKKLTDEISGKALESEKFHERMGYAFDRATEVKKQADSKHQGFLERRRKIDELYKKYKEILLKMNEISVKISEEKIEKTLEKMRRKEEEMKKQADEIMEKFKKGEKLSTEEFLILQETSK
ncbi:MAG: coiled-coil protein [Candidatus Methanofastidiosia archaeon]